jgi:Lon protease-like protein
MPKVMPVFPLAGALLLPRRPIQLTIFEPRYLAMLDDALSGERLIGMIQPSAGDEAEEPSPELCPIGCAGRIVQYAEIGDDRCFLTLMGVARFRVAKEQTTTMPYRLVRADFSDFADDFEEGVGENAVDRHSLVEALRAFAEANKIKVDWDDVDKASNETLVNGLAMLSPYGAKEKQALLEATDLKARAEILVAISQMELARSADASIQLH